MSGSGLEAASWEDIGKAQRRLDAVEDVDAGAALADLLSGKDRLTPWSLKSSSGAKGQDTRNERWALLCSRGWSEIYCTDPFSMSYEGPRETSNQQWDVPLSL